MTYADQLIKTIQQNIEEYNNQLIEKFKPTIKNWASLTKNFNTQFQDLQEILEQHRKFLKRLLKKGFQILIPQNNINLKNLKSILGL